MSHHLNVSHGSITHGRGYRQTCGQAALATIARLVGKSVTLEEACTAIGHRRCTTYPDLVRGLDALSIKHGLRVRHAPYLRPQAEGLFLCRVSGPNHFSHWVVKFEGAIYDSVLGVMHPNDYLRRQRARITSHMEIELTTDS